MLSALRDRRLRAQTSEHARIATLQREATEAQTALEQLYELVEKQIVSADEPTLRERPAKLIERRDLVVLARDRAIAASVASSDVDPAAIEIMTQDLRRKLSTGDVTARKAWLALAHAADVRATAWRHAAAPQVHQLGRPQACLDRK